MEKRLGDLNYRSTMLKVWQLIVAIAFLYFLVLGSISWGNILTIIIVHYVLYLVGLEIGYHKLLSHRSFATTEWIKNTLVAVGSLLSHPPVLQWVDLHRKHHGNSDKPKDPHSPWHPKRGLISYLFSTDLPGRTNSYEFKNDRVVQWFDYYQTHLIWGFSFLLLLIFDPVTVLVWYAVPSLISPYCLGIANYVTHQGKYNGYDYARNWFWIEILAPGMGFHGNHHDTPGTWTLAKKYWWADTSSIIVKLIKR